MAISRKAVTQARGSSGTTQTTAFFATNPANGDTIVVFQGGFNTGTHQAPTDNVAGAPNTYTQIGSTITLPGGQSLSVWRCENITGGSAFTVSGHMASAPSGFTVIAWALTGAKTPTSYNVDLHSATNSVGAANPSSGASSPAPAANSFFIGVMMNNGVETVTAGSGWAFETNSTQTDNSTFQDLFTEDLTGGATSSVVNTAQFTATSDTWIALVLSFAPLVAATTTHPDYERRTRSVELDHWERRQSSRYPMGAPPQIHQGATVLKTFPVPPVTAHYLAQYYVRDPNRLMLGSGNVGPDAQFDGATKLATNPVPPVTTNPSMKYHVADPNRLASTMAGPDPQLDGATNQPWFLYPVPQPQFRYYAPDVNRYLIGGGNLGPDPQFDGATKLATNPVPPVTTNPSLKYYVADPNRLASTIAGPDPQLDGATNQPWFLYPVAQPQFRYYVPDVNRYLLGGGNLGPDPQFDGATTQPTYLFPLLQPPGKYYQRHTWAIVTLPIDIAAAPVPQTYIFLPNQPELRRWMLHDPNRVALGSGNVGPDAQLDGATRHATYLFPPNQPEFARWAALAWARVAATGPRQQFDNTPKRTDPIPPVMTRPDAWFGAWASSALDSRRMTGPRLQLDGPTTQPWFLYPVAQPDVIRYAARETARRSSGPTPQTYGATSQQTHIFQTWQPDFRRYVRLTHAGPLVPVLGIVVAAPQTFIFPPSQPELRAFLELERSRRTMGPASFIWLPQGDEGRLPDDVYIGSLIALTDVRALQAEDVDRDLRLLVASPRTIEAIAIDRDLRSLILYQLRARS